MKYYNFADPQWREDFLPGHSQRWPGKVELFQLTDSVSNYLPEQEGFEDYISAVTKQTYTDGVKLTCRCMFESFGAPIVLISENYTEDSDGSVTYGPHFEICVYEKGCNVWFIVPFADVPLRTKAYKTAFAEFHLEGGEEITITAEIKGHFLHIDVNGHQLIAADPHIPESFHVGITACEGRNRIYDLTIE